MRLRRLLCGRAVPFRNRATLPNLVRAGRAGSACAPSADMQFVSLPGKPQAFRTAGGKAALGLANLDTIGKRHPYYPVFAFDQKLFPSGA